jgi:hypothetical protein
MVERDLLAARRALDAIGNAAELLELFPNTCHKGYAK